MFGFFKKKGAVLDRGAVSDAQVSRVLYVPEHAVEEVLALFDERETELGHYRLWTRIFELVPETKVGNWKVSVQQKFSKGIFVEEVLKGNFHG